MCADVAFKVGQSTNIKTLVLQIHYKDVAPFLGAGWFVRNFVLGK